MIMNPEGVILVWEYRKDGKLESWNEALGKIDFKEVNKINV